MYMCLTSHITLLDCVVLQAQVCNKEVPHFENQDNPDCDFVSLYEKYISKCPPDCNKFFLQSLTMKVVGHNPVLRLLLHPAGVS